jgi:hypothetical protein
MAAETNNFPDYDAFWPYYLSQHSNRATRLLHVAGTSLALLALLRGLWIPSLGWLIAAPILGYGAAWIAHAVIEKNHPATFTYPLWSLRGDFDMLKLWLSGKLEAELLKYKIMT